jgi:copper(I)-binding protein/cytochrome oxidase Cu insertion factor (SCO1/SenC/PrrC family)
MTALLCGHVSLAIGSTPWGANYFPNVVLSTQDGVEVRFFDDLIEDKVVVVNFIYTTCVDSCPLETAQLTRVQRILGDRVGQDIFFYSITIDPDTDTPAVLKAYREKFGARWTFLTGAEADIILLRKKLGLYIEEIQDGSKNHNVSMIIGNQKTGRWMRRSPFENPYVLADQIGNWLTGWKQPQQIASYAQAPRLRNISDGEKLFRTRCSICHAIGGDASDRLVGPNLYRVTERRDPNWLMDWIRAPDEMIAKGDSLALALHEQYQGITMPNLRLSDVDIAALMKFMEAETVRLGMTASAPEKDSGNGDLVAVTNARIRQPYPDASASAGYMTLVNIGGDELTLVGLKSSAFEAVELHEMVQLEGLPRMRKATPLDIPGGDHLRLVPGGLHLMLMRPHESMRDGQQVDVTLMFDSGREQTVSAIYSVAESESD